MSHPPLLPLDQALDQLLAALAPLPPTSDVPLMAASGQVLAAPVAARVGSPVFDNSAMDGYALRSRDVEHPDFGIVRRVLAGDAPGPALQAGECVRIFTGAPLPPGADCVVAQEDAELLTADGAPAARVRFQEQPVAGHHVRSAGQDFAAGTVLGSGGDLLDSRRIALLAAAGIDRVSVHPLPRIAILTTGNELRPPGAALDAGQIYNSNGPMLATLLRETGLPLIATGQPPATAIADDPQALRTALDKAVGEADAIICSGGVSVGEADFVREVMASEGEMAFWRLALKPGKPFAFGYYRGRPVFGLPGNPVSTWITFLLLVRPALLRLAGLPTDSPSLRPEPLTARLASWVRKRPGRREFQRAVLTNANGGELPEVTPIADQGSNLLSSLVNGNCLLDLPADCEDPAAGSLVRVIRLQDLQRGPI